MILSKVEKRMDEEFNRRVREASEKRAAQRIEELKSVEWPKWFEAKVTPKISELKTMINANVIKTLEGPWDIQCNKCQAIGSYQITSK